MIPIGTEHAIVAVGPGGVGVVLFACGPVLEGDLARYGGAADGHILADILPETAGVWHFQGELLYDRWQDQDPLADAPEESPEQDGDEVVVRNALWSRLADDVAIAVLNGDNPFGRKPDSRPPEREPEHLLPLDGLEEVFDEQSDEER